MEVVDKAMTAQVAVLDSDALIIRRDKNGEWPETLTNLIGVYDHEGQAVPFGMVLDHIADALASSQGVEP